jgi:hypothetical protein
MSSTAFVGFVWSGKIGRTLDKNQAAANAGSN